MDIVLYTRRGCHRCDAAAEILAWHAPQARIVEVDGDALLEREFGLRVPVITVDGLVFAEGAIDEADLLTRGFPDLRDRG